MGIYHPMWKLGKLEIFVFCIGQSCVEGVESYTIFVSLSVDIFSLTFDLSILQGEAKVFITVLFWVAHTSRSTKWKSNVCYDLFLPWLAWCKFVYRSNETSNMFKSLNSNEFLMITILFEHFNIYLIFFCRFFTLKVSCKIRV